MSTYNYDLRNIAFTFLGFVLDGGFGDDAALSINIPDPDYTIKKGVDGTITYCATGAEYAEVTVTLAQQAAANTVFAGIRQAAKLSPNGVGIGGLAIKDLAGAMVLNSPVARLLGPPAKSDYAAESKTREWVIGCPELTFFPGGSFPLSPV